MIPEGFPLSGEVTVARGDSYIRVFQQGIPKRKKSYCVRVSLDAMGISGFGAAYNFFNVSSESVSGTLCYQRWRNILKHVTL